MDRRDTRTIRKAHKYIRRWIGADGKIRYAYPSDQKRSNTRAEAKRSIAAKTKLITGIEPLEVRSEADINNAVSKMIGRYGKEGIACPALGNKPVFVTKKTLGHIKSSRGKKRAPESRNRKARYILYIPALLKNGRISEKSRSKEGVVYGVIGRVEYTRKDGEKARECVELAVAYDKKGKRFVLSFGSYSDIKKSLQKSRDFGNFGACQIVDAWTDAAVNPRYTITVPITVYSVSDNSEKINRKNKDLFEKHIDALLKSIGGNDD